MSRCVLRLLIAASRLIGEHRLLFSFLNNYSIVCHMRSAFIVAGYTPLDTFGYSSLRDNGDTEVFG
jgi:hypothetical protein